jgi:hypothetical protein
MSSNIASYISGATAVVTGTTSAAMSLVGFSSAGPVAGSLAAAWQASIGNVVAGSLFSTVQGAAMGTIGAAVTPVAVVSGLAFVAFRLL